MSRPVAGFVVSKIGMRPLAEIDRDSPEVAELGELAEIRTVRDFALLGRFPEQCSLLAEWLGLPLETIRTIVRQAAALIPPDELDDDTGGTESESDFPLGVQPPQAA